MYTDNRIFPKKIHSYETRHIKIRAKGQNIIKEKKYEEAVSLKGYTIAFVLALQGSHILHTQKKNGKTRPPTI